MNSVFDLLSHQARKWTRGVPASSSEIAELKSSIHFEWPDEFLDLLRCSNGGEGELALPPMWFHLYEIKETVKLRYDAFYRGEFPNFLFFGSNGGVEMIAFDLSKTSHPIVMIDPIGGPESAIQIAPNIDEFINAIGLEYNVNA